MNGIFPIGVTPVYTGLGNGVRTTLLNARFFINRVQVVSSWLELLRAPFYLAWTALKGPMCPVVALTARTP